MAVAKKTEEVKKSGTIKKIETIKKPEIVKKIELLKKPEVIKKVLNKKITVMKDTPNINIKPVKKTEDVKDKRISFVLDAPHAVKVMIAGSFNSWDPSATTLVKDKVDGKWKTKLALGSGRYEYKFVVDGNWINDPNTNNKVTNLFGSENSVIEV
ncbi:MAG: hypothetical protein V1872_09675 [bacterium]